MAEEEPRLQALLTERDRLWALLQAMAALVLPAMRGESPGQTELREKAHEAKNRLAELDAEIAALNGE